MKDGTSKGTYKRKKRPFHYNVLEKKHFLNIVILTLRVKR